MEITRVLAALTARGSYRAVWFYLLFSMIAVSGFAQQLALDTSLRLRYDDDQEGADFNTTVYSNLTITDLIKNRVDLKISGWGIWDLGYSDAYDRALERNQIRVSEAYIDIRNIGDLTRLRLGRQYLRQVDHLHLDGAHASFYENKPFSFFLFGGREVNYYQSARDDVAVGGGMIWKPNWKTRHQLDAYWLHESDINIFAAAWRWNQYWGNHWRTTSRLRFLQDGVRDYRGHLSKYFEPLGIGLDMDYYLQPRRAGEGDEGDARSVAALGRVLGPRVAQHRIALDLNKYFADAWLAQVGGSIRRRFRDEGDETYNGLESSEGHFSLTRFNLWIEGLDATISGEWYNGEQDSLSGLAGHLSYRPNKQWEFSGGLSYSRYHFDPIDFETKYNHQEDKDLLLQDLRVPVYFAEVRWKPNKTFDVRAEVQWENTNEDVRGDGVSARLTLNYHLRKSLSPPEEPSDVKKGAAVP